MTRCNRITFYVLLLLMHPCLTGQAHPCVRVGNSKSGKASMRALKLFLLLHGLLAFVKNNLQDQKSSPAWSIQEDFKNFYFMKERSHLHFFATIHQASIDELPHDSRLAGVPKLCQGVKSFTTVSRYGVQKLGKKTPSPLGKPKVYTLLKNRFRLQKS